MKIRAAEPKDSDQWLSIRNDPEALFWSGRKGPIPLEHHGWWFDKVLKDPNHILLVAEDTGRHGVSPPATIIGFARVEIKRVATVSFAVQSLHRGHGIGGGLLMALEECSQERGADVLRALVHPSNIPSMRAFIRQGYHLDPDKGFIALEKKLSLLHETSNSEADR